MLLKTRVLHFLIILSLTACSGTTRKETVVSKGEPITVSPPCGAPEDVSSEMQLKVLFASPRGDVSGQPEISVSFSLPMRELVRADADPLLGGKEPILIDPPIAGEFRWLGSRTVMFAPADPIPQATFFKLEVPAGLGSLSGKTLEEPYTWQF